MPNTSYSYNLRFTLPEQFGVTMYINSSPYKLYPLHGRLTDSFLSELLSSSGINKGFSFYSDPEHQHTTLLCFSEGHMSIIQDNCEHIYPIPFQTFYNALLAHLKTYALYFAAPYNYHAIMLKPFELMVKKMKTYQPKADEIINKIENSAR